MTTNHIYEKIRDDLPPGMEREIMLTLAGGYIGSDNRITRQELIRVIFGKIVPKGKLQNSTEDRQIRLSIEALQEMGYPVFSDSGRGGYYLGQAHEKDAYISELENRLRALECKIRALRTANKLQWSQPEQPPVQGRLF
jgi:hypothetical protein